MIKERIGDREGKAEDRTSGEDGGIGGVRV